MAAHTRALSPRVCNSSHCGMPATIEVFNTKNASCGIYCRYHGKKLVKDLNMPKVNQPKPASDYTGKDGGQLSIDDDDANREMGLPEGVDWGNK